MKIIRALHKNTISIVTATAFIKERFSDCFLLFPSVARPPNCFDVLTPAGLHELCADFADMLFNHAAVALRVIAPYRLIDTFFVKNLIRVRGQKSDDVKFPL